MPVPRISVVLPAYNCEAFIAEAIDSILGQTFEDFELVVIDDGSNDGTSRQIERFADPRIVRLVNDRNMGLIYSLNRGLEASRGDYIARMDGDDISHPTRLMLQWTFMEANPAVGVLGTQIRSVDRNGELLNVSNAPTAHEAIKWSLLFDTPIFHPTVMARRELLADAGGYDPRFLHIEDYELWARLISVTRFANLDEPLLSRRWHDASVCNRNAAQQYRDIKNVKKQLFEKFCRREVDHELVSRFCDSLNLTYFVLHEKDVKGIYQLLLQTYLTEFHDKGCGQDVLADIESDLIRRLYFFSAKDAARLNNLRIMRCLKRRLPRKFIDFLGRFRKSTIAAQ